MWFDSFYVSFLSSKYKNARSRAAREKQIGLLQAGMDLYRTWKHYLIKRNAVP